MSTYTYTIFLSTVTLVRKGLIIIFFGGGGGFTAHTCGKYKKYFSQSVGFEPTLPEGI